MEHRSQDRQWALFVILPTLLSIAVIAHHPVIHVAHHDIASEVVDGIDRIAGLNAAFHALILMLFAAQALGLFGLAERLGLGRVTVRAGVGFYLVSVGLIFVAGTLDGFVTPILGHRCAVHPEACDAMLGFEFAAIQGLTKVGLAAQSLALLCWSVAIGTTRRRLAPLACIGVVLEAAQLLLLASTTATIDPSRLALITAFAAAWSTAAGVLLWIGALDQPIGSMATVDR